MILRHFHIDEQCLAALVCYGIKGPLATLCCANILFVISSVTTDLKCWEYIWFRFLVGADLFNPFLILITSKHNCRVVLFIMEVQEQGLTASPLLENLTHACVPHVPQCDYSITSPVLSYLQQWPIIHLSVHQWLTPGIDFTVMSLCLANQNHIRTVLSRKLFSITCTVMFLSFLPFLWHGKVGYYNYDWCIFGILLPLESIFIDCMFLCLDRDIPERALFNPLALKPNWKQVLTECTMQNNKI